MLLINNATQSLLINSLYSKYNNNDFFGLDFVGLGFQVTQSS